MRRITPAELNSNQLNTIYQFNPRSRLKRFLARRTGSRRDYYSLHEVLMSLQQIIRKERMFDHSNPAIIICSSELERALDMKALHVSEIRDLVLLQLTKAPGQELIPRTTTGQGDQQTQRPTLPPKITKPTSVSITTYTNKHAKFTLRPNLLKVLQLVPGVDNEKTVFSYEEVTQILSEYILSRKDDIFDPRNIRLALVANDPIGLAFNVRSFHRCQINNLLKQQLIPFRPDCSLNPSVITQNNVSSVWKISITEGPIVNSEAGKPKKD